MKRLFAILTLLMLLAGGTALAIPPIPPGGGSSASTALSAPASDHTASGVTYPFTCGETLAIGDAAYVKSDGKLWLADADATTTMPAIGIMTVACTADQTEKTVLLQGVIRDDTWNWTVGGNVYVSTTGTTGNTLTQTAPSGSGDQVQIVGVAIHADYLLVMPNLVLVEVP